MRPADLDRLTKALEGARAPLDLAVVQLDARWVTDPQWRDAAIAFDDAALARFLRDPAGVVLRRVLPYDLPYGARTGEPVQIHNDWIERIRRNLGYLGAYVSRPRVQYRTSLFVAGRTGSRAELPVDLALAAPRDPALHAAFEDLWTGDRVFPIDAFEESLEGPYGDFDPLWYVNCEAGDGDRLR